MEQPAPRTGATIAVGVIDADDLRREGIAALLERSSEFTCSGTWENGKDAIAAIRLRLPDVLLLHVKLTGASYLDVLRSVAVRQPTTPVIALVDCLEERCPVLNPHPRPVSSSTESLSHGMFSEPDDCLQVALKMGARGVVRNPCTFAYLTKAIQTVYGGRYWIEYPIAARLAQQYLITLEPARRDTAGPDAENLTLRERQIVTLVSQGHSNKEIASELQVSYSTVKNYVSSILGKLDLSDRTQLAVHALHTRHDEAPDNGAPRPDLP